MEATFDLSDAYAGAAEKIVRGAKFNALTGAVRIEDQITKPSGQVVWRAFTDAAVEIRGEEVVLKKGGREIILRRAGSAGTWTVTDAKPPTPEENQNSKFRAVVLTIPRADQVSAIVEILTSR